LVESLGSNVVESEALVTGSGGSPAITPITVRLSLVDPHRVFLDFDGAAPGGGGGASVRIDLDQGLVSIDGIHKNTNLPPRSSGRLLAAGLQQVGVAKPVVLEAFNVERTRAAALASGGSGQGTRLGNLLEDAAQALGGTIDRWEPIKDGNIWHLRIHVSRP
jgi:hypothetical protein